MSDLASSQAAMPIPASQMSVTSQPSGGTKGYRPVRTLPYELRDHCHVYIEEELYSQAISLLLNSLIAGTDGTSDGRKLPAYIASTQIMALLATLTVHPTWTNRATEPEKVATANDALYLLQHINRLAGPSNANFNTAFQFSTKDTGRRDRRRRTEDLTVAEDDEGKFDVDMATKGAIWNRAEDFWKVVGWAFNCSTQYHKRWDRWRLWLKFMLDVLEDDLEQRLVTSKEMEAPAAATLLSESLIAQYLGNVGDGRAGRRRVMRAVLADGSKKSLDEFGEIWKNETKPPKQTKDERKAGERKKINVDENEYGDYMDLDDDDEDDDDEIDVLKPSRRQSIRTRGRPKSTTPMSDEEGTPVGDEASADYGGSESMALRKRFVALLTRICAAHEPAFMELEDCFDLLTEFIRPLPLAIFTQFVLPTTPYLEPHGQASLNQNLLRPIISSDAPVYHADTMTQREFEKHFLPYPANYTNYLENARVSLLVESLLRLLFRHAGLQVTESLKKKLDEGIKARKSKAMFGAKRKGGNREMEDEKAMGVLEMSAARMRAVVTAAERS